MARLEVGVTEAVLVELVADEVVAAVVGCVGEETTLLGPRKDAVERTDDDEADTTAWSCSARGCAQAR
jgi:hypothetical protein